MRNLRFDSRLRFDFPLLGRVMGAIVAVVVVVIAFVSAPTRYSMAQDPLSVEDLGIRGESTEAEVRV